MKFEQKFIDSKAKRIRENNSLNLLSKWEATFLHVRSPFQNQTQIKHHWIMILYKFFIFKSYTRSLSISLVCFSGHIEAPLNSEPNFKNKNKFWMILKTTFIAFRIWLRIKHCYKKGATKQIILLINRKPLLKQVSSHFHKLLPPVWLYQKKKTNLINKEASYLKQGKFTHAYWLHIVFDRGWNLQQ